MRSLSWSFICRAIIPRNSAKSTVPLPSASTYVIIVCSSSSVIFCPKDFITDPSSAVSTAPLPSSSNSAKHSLNSAIWSSVSSNAQLTRSWTMAAPVAPLRASRASGGGTAKTSEPSYLAPARADGAGRAAGGVEGSGSGAGANAWGSWGGIVPAGDASSTTAAAGSPSDSESGGVPGGGGTSSGSWSEPIVPVLRGDVERSLALVSARTDEPWSTF